MILHALDVGPGAGLDDLNAGYERRLGGAAGRPPATVVVVGQQHDRVACWERRGEPADGLVTLTGSMWVPPGVEPGYYRAVLRHLPRGRAVRSPPSPVDPASPRR